MFIFALLGILLLGMLIAIFGLVEGEEFSPDAFRRRKFSYYQLPMFQLQITPVNRVDVPQDVDEMIAKAIKAPGINSTSNTWEISKLLLPGGKISWEGESKILCDYLDLKNSEKSWIWEKWADKHPDMAKALWPIVADVARKGMYILIPDILEIAENADNVGELTGRIDEFLAIESEKLGDDYEAIGKIEKSATARKLSRINLPVITSDEDDKESEASQDKKGSEIETESEDHATDSQ